MISRSSRFAYSKWSARLLQFWTKSYRTCCGMTFSCLTFLHFIPCLRYSFLREVTAILLFVNFRWKYTVRFFIVSPAHRSRVIGEIRKSMCAWSSFRTSCSLVKVLCGLNAFLHMCWTSFWVRFKAAAIVLYVWYFLDLVDGWVVLNLIRSAAMRRASFFSFVILWYFILFYFYQLIKLYLTT